MSKKRTIERYENYNGFPENDIYWFHTREIDKLKGQIKVHQEKLDEMRRNCIHQFKFSTSGMYDDVYYCSECGERHDG